MPGTKGNEVARLRKSEAGKTAMMLEGAPVSFLPRRISSGRLFGATIPACTCRLPARGFSIGWARRTPRQRQSSRESHWLLVLGPRSPTDPLGRKLHSLPLRRVDLVRESPCEYVINPAGQDRSHQTIANVLDPSGGVRVNCSVVTASLRAGT